MEDYRLLPRQLIDHEKQFNKQSILQVADLLKDAGRQYYSIAIIGVQNSGKSTLLNLLFGTKFDVLQGTVRNKTTRGILVSLDKERDLIVFDVQGNDAIDNANDKEYEKMVSTYALSMANILIINVWQKTIGQNTGTQFDTLETIMKICVNEFRQQSPKTILFCMRDANPRRVQDSQDRILKQVNKIWEKIQDKPQKFKHLSSPELFLKVKFCSLPSYNFGNSQQFKDNINQLRQKFIDPSNKDYIFAYQDPKFNLPINDLPQLSQKAWQSIKNNEILNLPGQKIQLASFRCERISAKQQKKFQEKFLRTFLYFKIAIKLQADTNPPNIGEMINQSENAYDHQAYLYDQKVAKQKKAKMVEIMKDYGHKYIVDLIHFKMESLKEKFQAKLSTININLLRQQYQRQDNKKKRTLQESANQYVQEFMQKIVEFIKNLNYQLLDRKAKLDIFDKQLKQIFKNQQKKTHEDVKHQIQQRCTEQFKHLAIDVIQNNLENDFWAKCTEKFNETISKLFNYYSKVYHWVQVEQLDQLDLRFKKQQQFKKQIQNKLRDSFNSIMEEIFKKKMSIDQDNNKINYNIMTEEQIDELYSQSRKYILGLIYKINAPKSMIKSSFITPQQEQQQGFAFSWIKGSIDALQKVMMDEYEKIIRRKKQSEMRKVPIWLFGLMVFFVYDDLWFSADEYPIIHYLLLTILIIVLIMFAIGKGHILSDVVHSLADKVSILK